MRWRQNKKKAFIFVDIFKQLKKRASISDVTCLRKSFEDLFLKASVKKAKQKIY